MSIELGAKKDIYTGVRCMASGILLGRMAAGLASVERNLENTRSWSPLYAMHFGAESAYKAAQQIERLQTTARSHLKSFSAKMEPYKNYNSSYVDKEKASQAVTDAKKDLAEIAQLVVKTCGKRRPVEGEGEALLQMKTVKREGSPRPKKVPMDLPVPEEPAQSPSSSWPVIVGVLMIIGATFFMR